MAIEVFKMATFAWSTLGFNRIAWTDPDKQKPMCQKRRDEMLFVNCYRPKDNLSEEQVRRIYEVWIKWKRPEGVNVIAHYHTGICRGVEILEANSAEEIIEFNMPWIPYLEPDVRPAIDSKKITELIGGVIKFWDSV